MSAFIQTTEGAILPFRNIKKLRAGFVSETEQGVFADQTLISTASTAESAQKLLDLLVVHVTTKDGIFSIDSDANTVVRKWSNAVTDTVGKTTYPIS
jgi:hypothetical protein